MPAVSAHQEDQARGLSASALSHRASLDGQQHRPLQATAESDRRTFCAHASPLVAQPLHRLNRVPSRGTSSDALACADLIAGSSVRCPAASTASWTPSPRKTRETVIGWHRTAWRLLCLRELKNVIERALLIWPGDTIQPEAFAEILAANNPRRSWVGGDVSLRDFEREHISRIMTRLRSLTGASGVLGIDKTRLWRRLKHYDRMHALEL